MTLLAIAYLAFVGLGLPDALPGVLWPVLRPHYGLPTSALGLVLGAVTTGTFLASLVAGRAVLALGVGGVLAASVGATALAALGQAMAPPWWAFVALALWGGLGAGAVDACLNAFAARNFAARHLNWLHACWGVGATLGPALATLLLAAGTSWRAGYALVGAMLASLALLFLATRGRWTTAEPAPHGAGLNALAALRHPVVLHQIMIFALYTGTESSAGQWAATILIETRGASPQLAGTAATLFWAALTLGRVALGFVVDRVGPDQLMRRSVAVAACAALLLALNLPGTSLPALALLAASLSPLYPTMMARTPARLGLARAMHAVGFQVGAGTVGNALLPGLLGLVADRFGVAMVPGCIAVLALILAVLVWKLPAPIPAATGSPG